VADREVMQDYRFNWSQWNPCNELRRRKLFRSGFCTGPDASCPRYAAKKKSTPRRVRGPEVPARDRGRCSRAYPELLWTVDRCPTIYVLRKTRNDLKHIWDWPANHSDLRHT